MDSRASTLPEPKPEFGPQFASHGSRSAPVGFHHFDGFLRSVSSGRIASRYRTWGSLGFRGARRHHPKTDRTRSSSPPAPHPSKVCSSSVAVPHRWGLLPPDRSYPKRRKPPPDGRTRVDEWGNTPCVSRSDRARATSDGGAFPPFRHRTRAPLAWHSRCWSLCELSRDSSWGPRVTPGHRPPALEPGHIDLAVDRITGPPREPHWFAVARPPCAPSSRP